MSRYNRRAMEFKAVLMYFIFLLLLMLTECCCLLRFRWTLMYKKAVFLLKLKLIKPDKVMG